jgi:hypothetical protein
MYFDYNTNLIIGFNFPTRRSFYISRIKAIPNATVNRILISSNQLYTVNPDGSNPVPLTHFPRTPDLLDPDHEEEHHDGANTRYQQVCA